VEIKDATLYSEITTGYNIIDISDLDVLLKLHNVNFDFNNNVFPIVANRTDITHDEPTTWKFTDSSLNEYYMYSSFYGQPATTNVRDGVLY